MNDKSKLPSKLLDLPNELWHHIMSSDRKPRFGDDSHFKSGYVNRARYRSLRNTSLAHRILQPFAQEELLSVLEILANESLDMLLTTLEGSDRLASYAKRTEKINLIVDDEKIEDGVLSRLARLCPNVHEIHSTNVSIDLSGITRFTKLRRLNTNRCIMHVEDPLQSLPHLTRLDVDNVTWSTSGFADASNLEPLRSFCSATQLPALCHLFRDDLAVQSHGTLYDTLLPQLTHLDYFHVSDFDDIFPQLQHCTALKSLRITCDGIRVKDISLPFIRAFKALHLVEFHFTSQGGDDDKVWRRTFPAVQRLMEITEDHPTLKKLSLKMWHADENRKRAEAWIKLKEDVRRMCAKKKIQIVRFEDHPASERYDLVWVD